jgi:hypothetical protein
VQKARAKLEGVVASQCGVAPDFGVTDATTAGASAAAQDVGLFHDLFGEDLAAWSYRALPRGRAPPVRHAMQSAYERIFQAQLREFLVCKKAGLQNGTITSRAGLRPASMR